MYVISIVSHTPYWVWLVLALVVYLGISRMQPRESRPAPLAAISVIFVLLAIAKLARESFSAPAVLGVAAGVLLALLALSIAKPARDTVRLDGGRLRIAGEWHSLVILVLIFSANYFSAVLRATDPAMAHSVAVIAGYSLVNGFASAFMTGRTIGHLAAPQHPAAQNLPQGLLYGEKPV